MRRSPQSTETLARLQARLGARCRESRGSHEHVPREPERTGAVDVVPEAARRPRAPRRLRECRFRKTTFARKIAGRSSDRAKLPMLSEGPFVRWPKLETDNCRVANSCRWPAGDCSLPTRWYRIPRVDSEIGRWLEKKTPRR